MPTCRFFFGASLFAVLVVQNSSDGAAVQNQPGTPGVVSNEVRAACNVAYGIATKTPGVSSRRAT